MAVICSSPQIIIHSNPIKKHFNRVLMLHNSHLPANKQPALHQIRSSIDNKVFEDQSRGIVCYRNDRGEIICEGYDEGPRFYPEAPKPAYHDPRELCTSDLLQQSLFQIIHGNGCHHAEKGVALQEDFD